MKKIVITNNPLVKEKYSKELEVEYYQVSYIDLLKKVRDRIHKGSKLLTHPLSGSVKPNETPYKTVIIQEDSLNVDMDSLLIIESSISTAQKFINDKLTPEWNERIIKDFQVIDLSLIDSVIKNI